VASARFPGSRPEATGRAWYLVAIECPDGRIAVAGLPEDREARLSLAMRLRDLLAAVAHADACGQGDGELWRRYARQAYASLVAEGGVTVELVEAER
jgi:hypothetical protein